MKLAFLVLLAILPLALDFMDFVEHYSLSLEP